MIDGSLSYDCLEEYLHLWFTDTELTGVPGLLLERIDELSDVTIEPYGVPKLNFYTGWWKRLGLERSAEHIFEEGVPFLTKPVYRKTKAHESEQQWHHWIYLSNHHPNSTNAGTKRWDEGFDELVRYHNVHPAAHNAGFHYASCAESDLCNLWLIEAPAIVHFTTAGSRTHISRKIYTDDATYNSVAIRIFHLPLQPAFLRLPPGVFPSPFNHLRSLTDSRDERRRFKPFRASKLAENRINKRIWTKLNEWQSYKALNTLVATVCSVTESRGFSYLTSWSQLVHFSGIMTAPVLRLPWVFLESLMSTIAERFSSEDDEELPPEPLRKVAFNLMGRFRENRNSIMQIAEANELFESIRRLIPDDLRGLLVDKE